MNLSVWAIKRPAPVILLFIFLTVLGLQSFFKLPVQNMPDFDLPTVTVSVSLPGAAPSALETEVTRLVEDSVASLNGIQHITSTVTEGASMTTIEFGLNKDVQEAVNDVRDAVSRVRGQFPAEVMEPVVARVNIASGVLLTYAVSSDSLSELDQSWLVDHDISKRLMAVQGVAQVVRQGGLSREIAVTLKPDQLQALGTTAAEISRQLATMQREVPGGRATVAGSEQSIRTINLAEDAAALRELYVTLSDGRKVKLGAVAEVTDGAKERQQQALLDGTPVVSFQVMRATGYSELEVATRVRAAVKELEPTLKGVALQEVTDYTKKIKEQYDSSMQTLYEGAALAILVVWLFLRDVRATVVASVALPLSIIPTFFFMHQAGITLNGVTLLALTLVVGVLVDDAIVEVENIVRHLRQGLSPLEAAKEAATEIGLAVIATTFTLVAVFLPTAFMGGIPGKFFKQFGWTAAISVLVSLLVARMLTPLMAAYLLKDHPAPLDDGPVMRWYLRKLEWVLSHPLKTLGLASAFFVGSLSLVPLLSSGFIPPAQQGKLNLQLELAPGSSFAQTRSIVETALTQLKSVEGIKQTYATIGTGSSGSLQGGGARAGEVRTATIALDLVDHIPQVSIEKAVRAALVLPGTRIAVGGLGSGQSYSLVLSGDNPKLLTQAARAVEQDLRTLKGVGAVSSSASLTRPEVVVRPDSAKAADLGVTTASIGQTLRVATAGDSDTNLAKLNLPERQVPVRVQLPAAIRGDLEQLAQIKVPAKNGAVPLFRVADLSLENGAAQINRYDRSRNVTVSVELAGRALGDVAREAESFPSVQQLPSGVKRQASGEAERMAELMGGFVGAMLLGVFCIYGVLVLLLHNFIQPFTILSALPLAVGGALAALLVGNYTLSLPSLIGLLMLMGVVTKNSILLVDYAMMAKKEGATMAAAVKDACHKRARPILMTTVAMVSGMVPLIAGWSGGDSSFRAPMAATVIGGLVTSTALSLLVVPAVFVTVGGIQERLSLLLKKWHP